MGSLEPHLSPEGNLLVMPLFMGGVYGLNWLRVGGNVPPNAELLVDPIYGPRGEMVLAVPSSVRDLDGWIQTIMFDWNGDGIYEAHNNEKGRYVTKEYTGSQDRTLNVGVQVTDNEQATAEDFRTIQISGAHAQIVGEGQYSSAALAGDGVLHLAYYKETPYSLMHAWGIDGEYNTETVVSPLVSLESVDITLDNDDVPWLVYYGGEPGEETYRFHKRETEGWLHQAELEFDPVHHNSHMDARMRFAPDGTFFFASGGALSEWNSQSPVSVQEWRGDRWLPGPEELADEYLDLAVDMLGNAHFVYEYGLVQTYMESTWMNEWSAFHVPDESGPGAVAVDSDNDAHWVFATEEYLAYTREFDGYWIPLSEIVEWNGKELFYPLSVDIAFDHEYADNPHVVLSVIEQVSPGDWPNYVLYYAYLDYYGIDWEIVEIRRGELLLIPELTLEMDASRKPVISCGQVPGLWPGFVVDMHDMPSKVIVVQ